MSQFTKINLFFYLKTAICCVVLLETASLSLLVAQFPDICNLFTLFGTRAETFFLLGCDAASLVDT